MRCLLGLAACLVTMGYIEARAQEPNLAREDQSESQCLGLYIAAFWYARPASSGLLRRADPYEGEWRPG